MGRKKLITLISSIAAAVVIATVVIIIIVANGNNGPAPTEEGYRTIKVFETTGTVEVIREENVFAASKGQNLKSEDYLRVGDSSAAIMKLDEDKFVYADENTKLHITATGEKGHTKTNIFVVEGSAIIELQSKLVNDESFDILSANTAMAIRGTQIKITVQKTSDSYVIEYMVAEGNVEITAIEDMGDGVTSGATIKEQEMEVITFTIPLDEAFLEDTLVNLLQELTTTVYDSVEDYKKEYDDIIINYREMTKEEYNEIKNIVDEFRADEDANYWTSKLTVNDSTYGDEYYPSARANFGTVVYKYSSDGIRYTGEKPVNAGTYYVIAYTSDNTLESDPRMFTISKAIPVFPHLSITVPEGTTADAIASDYLGDWYFQSVTPGRLSEGHYIIVYDEDQNYEGALSSFELYFEDENDPKCSVTSINVEVGKTLADYADELPSGWEFVSPELSITSSMRSTQVRTVVEGETYYDSVSLVVAQPANIAFVKSIDDDSYQIKGFDPNKQYYVGDIIDLYIEDSLIHNYEFIAIKNGDEVICSVMPTEEDPFTITITGDVTYVVEFRYSNDDFIFVNGVVTSVDSSASELVIPSVDTNGNTITSIGDGAFKNNTNLVSITIPSTVKEIGASAFEGCTALKNITINSSSSRGNLRQHLMRYSDDRPNPSSTSNLVKIGNRAFYGCTALQMVVLPDSVEELGEYAFYNCTALQVMSIPSNLEIIGQYALANTILTNVDMSTSKVSHINNYAFSGCNQIETFIPSDYLKYIGTGALPKANDNKLEFNYASDENIQYLGNSSNPYMIIYGRKYSNSISYDYTLKDEALFVYDNAFANEANVKNIPSSLIGVGYRAFYYCQNIENPYTLDTDGITKLYSSYIPEGLEYIGVEAFYYNTGAKNIEFGSSLQYIGDSAFSGSLGLTKVAFNETENELIIGDYAFEDCTHLSDLVLTENLDLSSGYYQFQNIGVEELEIPNIVTIGQAFNGCLSLETVNIAANVEELDSTFIGCTALKTVTFAEGTKIDRIPSAFMNCKLLENINLPNTVSYITDNSFTSCPALEETEYMDLIYLGIGDNPYFIVKSLTPEALSNPDVTQITIEEGAKMIYPYIFQGSYVERVDIPDSMTTISEYAFASSSYYSKSPIKEVLFSSSNKLTSIGDNAFFNSYISEFSIPNTVKYIGEYAFYGTQITRAEIPNGITEINRYAFASTPIEYVSIPNSVKTIGECAFSGCSSLVDVCLSGESQVELIDDYAFSGCALINFDFPSSVKSLGYGAFMNCTQLCSMDISSIDELSPYLFSGCTKLEVVKLSPTLSKLYERMFEYCSSLQYIIIPASVKEIEKTTLYKCTSLKNITFEDDSLLTDIPESFAEGCSALTSLEIPKKVVTIAAYAFYGCPITTLTFDEDAYLNTIGKYAFNYAQLRSLSLSDNVLSIGEYAFYNSPLETIDISYEAVVGNNAFYSANLTTTTICDVEYVLDKDNNPKELMKVNDKSITEFDIPATVKKIGARAFEDCKSLTSITIPASVIQIDQYAFSGCNYLAEVNFEENCNLKIIANYAFYNCKALAEIKIPEGVKSIGEYAFSSSGSSASSLHTVYIPSTIATIGYGAFDMCKNLVEVYNDSELLIKAKTYDSYSLGTYAEWVGTTELALTRNGVGIYNDNGILVIKKSDGKYYVVGYDGESSDLVLPNTLNYYDQTINEYYINGYAFEYNTKIKTLSIGTGLIAINEYAFYNAYNLESITLQNNSKLTTFSVYSFKNDVVIENMVASSKSSLTEVIIPNNNSLTDILNYAFSGNLKLNSFDLTKTTKLTKIGDYAFEYAAFEEVFIPKSVTPGKSIFEFNDSLTKVTFEDGYSGQYLNMFAECRSIEEITMPLNNSRNEAYYIIALFSKSISYGYDYKDDFLTPKNYSSNHIPKSFTKLIVTSGHVGNIYDVPSLKEVVVGENVTSFNASASNAFSYCYNLEKIYYNCKNVGTASSAVGKLRDAGKNAVNGLQIIIGNTVEALGSYFTYCGTAGANYISSIVFADDCKLTSLPAQCFNGNTRLATITIPACITSISNSAFSGCTGLTEINYEGSSYIWNFMNISASDINNATVNCDDSACHLLEIATIGYSNDVEYLVDGVSYTAPINMPMSHRFSLDIITPEGYQIKSVIVKYVISEEEKANDITDSLDDILMNSVPMTIEVEFIRAE